MQLGTAMAVQLQEHRNLVKVGGLDFEVRVCEFWFVFLFFLLVFWGVFFGGGGLSCSVAVNS